MTHPNDSGPQWQYGDSAGGAQPTPQYDAGTTPYQPINPYGAPASPYGAPNPPPIGQYNVYGGAAGYPPVKPTNGMAITGFVLSLAGLIPYLGALLAIGGMVFSLIGMSQTKRTGEGGRGLAIAGVCISGVILALYVVAVIIVIIVFAGAASSSTYR